MAHESPGGVDLAGGRSLEARIRQWRNRMIANPAFRAAINRFAPLRFLARRKSRHLFELVSGFVRSQIVFASVESGLIELLAGDARSEEEIARRLGLEISQASRLIESAAAVGLIVCGGDGLWRLDDAGAVLCGDPGIVAMIRHHALLYRDLADPVQLLRNPHAPTLTHELWSYVRGETVEEPPAMAADYSALMTASQDMLIDEVLAAYRFGGCRSLLDVGGGEGAFLRAAGRKHPHLRLMLFDLPSVTSLPAAAGGPPVERFSGDFFADALPGGADCITLLRVVCDHEDEQVLKLLRNIRAALGAAGTLLIAEPMAGPAPEQAMVAAYFGFYFLAMRSGRCRSAVRIAALLRQAGFTRISPLGTRAPLAASLVRAQI